MFVSERCYNPFYVNRVVCVVILFVCHQIYLLGAEINRKLCITFKNCEYGKQQKQ